MREKCFLRYMKVFNKQCNLAGVEIQDKIREDKEKTKRQGVEKQVKIYKREEEKQGWRYSKTQEK